MTFFTILNIRYQWEENVRGYKIDPERKNGTVDNISWFIQHGAASNRFRKGFNTSIQLAERLLEKYNEEINISSLHRK